MAIEFLARRRVRFLSSGAGRLLAGAAALVAAAQFAGPASAQGFEGTAEEREACMSDAFSFCSSAIPDAARVKACLEQNMSELSPGCRHVFEARAKAKAGR